MIIFRFQCVTTTDTTIRQRQRSVFITYQPRQCNMLICQYQLKTPALYLNLVFSVQPLALIPKNFLLKKKPDNFQKSLFDLNF